MCVACYFYGYINNNTYYGRQCVKAFYLEKLVSDNQLYKGRHHLSKTTRVRLVSAVRCAIRVRSKEYNDKKCDKNTAVTSVMLKSVLKLKKP
jgi:hypothetical protein